jgi:20S proteasome alpha/beta subunit
MARTDWLLTFLGVAPAGGWKGFNGEEYRLDPIRIMKGLFLAQNEDPDGAVVPIPNPPYQFRPYAYGPFTAAVYADLDDLLRAGAVERETRPSRTYVRWRLTDAGRTHFGAAAHAVGADGVDRPARPMTLVIGIATPKGVVLGADGLVSWSSPGGAPTFQTPTTKVFPIGSCFACGVSGSRHLDEILARALQASGLKNASPGELAQAAATTIARDVVKDTITEYVQHIAFNPARPLTEQIGAADLLLVGLCSDGPLLVGLDQTGNWYPPATPNYYAVGSGALSALLLLRAYSKYSYTQHPLQTSVLLTKRILDMVIATTAEIGGQISIVAISATADTLGKHSAEVDVNGSIVQAGMQTWELLEEEMYEGLTGSLAGAGPTTTAPVLGELPETENREGPGFGTVTQFPP